MVDRVSVVTDLGYGDSGKGAFVDYLCAKEGATLVIRNNGGAQAGHNVVTPDGRHHCFSQFGAGTFAGAMTYLGHNMLVSPMYLLDESKKLEVLGIPDPMAKLFISPYCRIVTPYHELTNRVRETVRGENRHGSCGYGIGELMEDQFDGQLFLTMNNLLLTEDSELVHENYIRTILYDTWGRKAQVIRDLSGQTLENFDDEIIEFYKLFARKVSIDYNNLDWLSSLLTTQEHVVFEGAQGVMIDETYGFHPYTTWSDTTPRSAWKIIEEFPAIFENADIHNYGLFRAYSTRHGAGPFPSYSQEWTNSLNDPHNPTNQWQGNFKCGPFDLVAAKYALNVCQHVGYPIDSLVFSCLDQLDKDVHQVVYRYYANIQPGGYEWSWIVNNQFTVPQDELCVRFDTTQLILDHVSDDTNTVLIPFDTSVNYISSLATLLAVPISYTADGPTRDERKRLNPTS